MRKGPAIAIVSLMVLAFIATALYLKKDKPVSTVTTGPYHAYSLGTSEEIHTATKQELVDGLYVPAGPGQYITWQCTVDGSEVMACAGKDNNGLFVKECCGENECTRIAKSTWPQCQTYVYNRLP